MHWVCSSVNREALPMTISSRVSPYARLNLRRNPFGELTREERADMAVVLIERWLPLLRDPRTAVQFIGPCGHGKTTHLLAIERGLPGATYIYLPEVGVRPIIPIWRPLLIDEAQRLSYWQRRRVFKLGGPLVLGTHEDLTSPLRRHGLKVTTVEVAADQSPQRLKNILNRRIEASRLSDSSEVPSISLDHVLALQTKFGSDIRRMEHYLYDHFQLAARNGWPCPAR